MIGRPPNGIYSAGGSVVVNADGSVTITPTAAKNVTLASGGLLLEGGQFVQVREGSSYAAIAASGGAFPTGAAGFYTDGAGRIYLRSYDATTGVRIIQGSLDFAGDLFLYRDAANVLAQRNGANPQKQRWANTWTDGSNYEYGFVGWVANVFQIGTEKLGTGLVRGMKLLAGDNTTLTLGQTSTDLWQINGGGHLLAATDGLYDIGASGATRPRDLHLSRTAYIESGNGQQFGLKTLTELTTVAAAATTDTTIQIPANAVVLAVSVRVVTVIPTAATFDVGVAGATTRYGTGLAVAAGTTNPGTNDATRYYASAAAVRITPNVAPAAATGQVRVTIHYYEITAPTS